MTLVSTHENRPNNWGTHAGAARAAVARYLGDSAPAGPDRRRSSTAGSATGARTPASRSATCPGSATRAPRSGSTRRAAPGTGSWSTGLFPTTCVGVGSSSGHPRSRTTPGRRCRDRPIERRGDIGAGAPLVGDGEIDGGAAFRHVDRLHVDQPVVDDADQRDAGEARVEPAAWPCRRCGRRACRAPPAACRACRTEQTARYQPA